MDQKKMPLGLYIHWPFCLSKCPYCDFNSHVRSSIAQDRFKEALLMEMRWMAAWIQERNQGASFYLNSLFFGGGTPSLMDPQTVAALILQAKSLWPSSSQLEVTLEANPTSVEAEKFEHFREGGVNRLSLGIQSLRKENLTFLGRNHTTTQSHQALQLASSIFPRFSFDLIYALPSQTLEAWTLELEEALATYGPKHISLYQLTYEPGTPFYTRFQRGDLKEPLEDTAVALFEITQTLTKRYGLEAYEVSNYATLGEASSHNLGYWRGNIYAGIGPGAHSRLKQGATTWALQTHKNPEKWLSQVETQKNGVVEMEALTPRQRFLELFSMGLRLQEGIPFVRFEEETGYPFERWFHGEYLSLLQQSGFLIQIDQKIRLTPQGRLRLNAILAYCLKQQNLRGA